MGATADGDGKDNEGAKGSEGERRTAKEGRGRWLDRADGGERARWTVVGSADVSV